MIGATRNLGYQNWDCVILQEAVIRSANHKNQEEDGLIGQCPYAYNSMLGGAKGYLVSYGGRLDGRHLRYA